MLRLCFVCLATQRLLARGSWFHFKNCMVCTQCHIAVDCQAFHGLQKFSTVSNKVCCTPWPPSSQLSANCCRMTIDGCQFSMHGHHCQLPSAELLLPGKTPSSPIPTTNCDVFYRTFAVLHHARSLCGVATWPGWFGSGDAEPEGCHPQALQITVSHFTLSHSGVGCE